MGEAFFLSVFAYTKSQSLHWRNIYHGIERLQSEPFLLQLIRLSSVTESPLKSHRIVWRSLRVAVGFLCWRCGAHWKHRSEDFSRLKNKMLGSLKFQEIKNWYNKPWSSAKVLFFFFSVSVVRTRWEGWLHRSNKTVFHASQLFQKCCKVKVFLVVYTHCFFPMINSTCVFFIPGRFHS